jgi:hypothetical protein
LTAADNPAALDWGRGEGCWGGFPKPLARYLKDAGLWPRIALLAFLINAAANTRFGIMVAAVIGNVGGESHATRKTVTTNMHSATMDVTTLPVTEGIKSELHHKMLETIMAQ